jgi:hypothetical protein
MKEAEYSFLPESGSGKCLFQNFLEIPQKGRNVWSIRNCKEYDSIDILSHVSIVIQVSRRNPKEIKGNILWLNIKYGKLRLSIT